MFIFLEMKTLSVASFVTVSPIPWVVFWFRFMFACFFFFFFLLFGAPWHVEIPRLGVACGDSQARGQTRATAPGPHHSHSNAESEPHLQPVPQVTVLSDP